MKLSRLAASKRTEKGWVTRRRGDPTRYGNVIKKGTKTYWKRPSGQKIELQGFSHSDIQRMNPAMVRTDQVLKKHVQPDVKKIEKVKPGLLSRKKKYLGGYTVPYGVGPINLGSPKIFMNQKELNSGAASGILAHEIGHSVFPGSRGAPRSKLNDFKESFGYKGGSDIRDVKPTSNNPLNRSKGKTRQSVDSAEDFAETFRAETGLSIGKSHYFNDIYVDQPRQRFMKKHYIR